MKGYINVLDFHLWVWRWGVTLTLVNDWVDFRWHQLFLELMVLSWMRKRYLQVGLALRLGAVPLIGLMYNQSLLASGDTRGVSLHVLGISAALRVAPRHFGDEIERAARKADLADAPPSGIPFVSYDLTRVPEGVIARGDQVRVAMCKRCRESLFMPTHPWPILPEAVMAELDLHAANCKGVRS